MSQNFNLLLNSTSPRRLDILSKIISLIDSKIIIEIIKPTFEEDLNKSDFDTSKDYLLENTKRKCCGSVIEKATSQFTDGKPIIIVSADTILTNSNYSKVLEKPDNAKHNYDMIVEQVEDGCVICMTSVQITVIKDGVVLEKHQTLSEAKIILDKSLLEKRNDKIDLIQQYVNSGEGLDAAGGFKIQETGSFMVEKIDGDFYTVVGLPFNSTMMTLIEVINKL
ncbi:hypothetical protein ACO0SA_001500 [Hanseniaspora valbyensis]